MTEPSDSSGGDDVVARRELDTTIDAPAIELIEIVADLEGTDPTALEPMYDRIDDLVDGLFSSPPSPAASAELEFTYQGYRIHVEQDGTTTVRPASS